MSRAEIDNGTAEIRRPDGELIGFVHVDYDIASDSGREIWALRASVPFPLRGPFVLRHLEPHPHFLNLSRDQILKVLQAWADLQVPKLALQGIEVQLSATPGLAVPRPDGSEPAPPPVEQEPVEQQASPEGSC